MHAAVRHGSTAPCGGGAANNHASSSRTDETSRSTTTTGPSRAVSDSAAWPGGAGSGASAVVCPGSSNGRVSRYRCAMASLSLSLYAGSSITSSRVRTGSGIPPASVAVTIHSAADRSNGTWRYSSPERAPARGVQDVEQRVGGVRCHPVELFENEDRIAYPGFVQTLDDAPGDTVLDPADQALGIPLAQRHAHVGAAERRGDGHRQRRLARSRRPGEAGNGRGRPGWSRAYDQRGRPVGLRSPVAAHAFHGERAAGLRARRQHLQEAGLDPLEAAVGAVERPRHIRRVEPLRLARSPRQGQHHLRPVQRLVDRRRIGPERTDAAPQRLTRRTGQLGGLQGIEHLIEARAGGGQRAHGLERRSDGPAASRRRNLGGGAGKRCLRRPEPGSTVAEQAQRLRLVHYSNPARGRQVGQAPPLALRRGGDHVGAARGPASALRTARTPG